MDNLNNIAQKYRQASWRTQRQWLGLILLGVIVAATVAGIYLSVSNQATAYGTEILNLNYWIADNQRKNADLRTQLAKLASAEEMQARAHEMGYEPVEIGEILFVVVPGYTPKTGLNLATHEEELTASIIRPEYKETLFEWITTRIQSSAQVTGAQQ